MTKPRPFQVHIFLRAEFAAAVAGHGPLPEAMKPLMEVLERHHAVLDHTRAEEFNDFIRALDTYPEIKERGGPARRLYDLAKAALENPLKRDTYTREFALSMESRLVFTGHQADALIADLRALEGGAILTNGRVFHEGKMRKSAPVRKVYIPRHHPGSAAYKS